MTDSLRKSAQREENDPYAERFLRTEMLLGEARMRKLAASRVAVFGLGGVGGYVVEALARSGIGALDLIDPDVVSVSNRNRQILATEASVGLPKTEVAASRVRQIHPECTVRTFPVFFLPETASSFSFADVDYIADAIDTVTGKLALIEQARQAGVPVISSMGTGNKLDPGALRVADLYDTDICPLARIMRKECRKRGIDHLKVVYSTEPPVRPDPHYREAEEDATIRKRDVPGSIAMVPAVAGMMIAAEILRDLM